MTHGNVRSASKGPPDLPATKPLVRPPAGQPAVQIAPKGTIWDETRESDHALPGLSRSA
jgi:hypothetical protein